MIIDYSHINVVTFKKYNSRQINPTYRQMKKINIFLRNHRIINLYDKLLINIHGLNFLNKVKHNEYIKWFEHIRKHRDTHFILMGFSY